MKNTILTNTEACGNERLNSIVWLRGVAALSVAWFHFTHGNAAFLDEGFIKNTGKYCWLGVEIFFVISGFIIPWSLVHSKYDITQYFRFFAKRLIRVEPVYITSIILIVGLNYLSSLSPLYNGQRFYLDIQQILFHFLYLNTFFDKAWLNPVFWTLAIEFQYYLVIGIAFLLFFSKKFITRSLIFCLFVIIFLLSINLRTTFLYYIPLFLIGITCCQRKINLISFLEFIFYLIISLSLSSHYDPAFPFIGIGIVFVIFYLHNVNPIMFWLGEISYSIYLLHVPIGGRVINLSLRFAYQTYEKILILLAALILTLICSYLFYLFIEKPCINLSKKIKYKYCLKLNHNI